MVKLKLFGKKDGPLLHPEGEFAKLQLFRHFKVLKVLGRGSFATVYQVQRRSDGQSYAMKHIDIRAIEPAERTDLVNEIRLLASLDHPNLMKYYEAFVEQHQLFIVTELVAKGDLGTLLERRAEYEDWLPERQIWSYFLQLAVGIQYLHHSHVLHRDLKPQNVLMAEGGLLKIADLGISQMLDHVFTRVLMGTPHYIAPEMWRRRPYSYSADIWALGCILHEMCTLRPLFLANTELEIRDKVLSGLLDSIPSRYSVDLWDVIRSMLNHDPAERPTIDEVLAMPAVQARLSLLPVEDLPYLDPFHEDHAEIMQLVRISSRFDRWDELNDLLPPSKYAQGPGVVETLRLRRPSSCPDLARRSRQLPRQQQGDKGGRGNASSAPLAVPGGGSRRRFRQDFEEGGGREEGEGCSPPGAYATGSLPRGWEGCMDRWAAEAESTRRRSIAVGEMMYGRQKEAEQRVESQLWAVPGSPRASTHSSGGGGSMSGTAGTLGSLTMKRTKSSGELLPGPLRGPSKIQGIQGGVQGSSPQQGASAGGGASGRFDSSPIEFGGGGGGRSSGSGVSAAALLRPPLDGGRGQHAQHAAAAGGMPAHAATMVAAVGTGAYGAGLSPPFRSSNESSGGEGHHSAESPTGVMPALGNRRSAHSSSQHGQTAPAGALSKAAPTGSSGGREGGAGQPGIGASGGKREKEKKKKGGKVRFKSRLRALLFGPEEVEGGGMHQPMW